MNQEQTTREQVIDELRKGRVTPKHLVEQTEVESKQNASYHLRQLRAEDRVRKVSRGLYELVDEPSAEKVVELPDGGEKISEERWELIRELVDNSTGDAR